MRIDTVRIGFFLSISRRSKKRMQIKNGQAFHAQPIFNSQVHRLRLFKVRGSTHAKPKSHSGICQNVGVQLIV